MSNSSKDCKEEFIIDICNSSFSSISEASEKYGVCERTIYRWLSEHSVITAVLSTISGTVLLSLPKIFQNLIALSLANNSKAQRLFFSFIQKSLPQLLSSFESEEPYQNIVNDTGDYDLSKMSHKQLCHLLADTNIQKVKSEYRIKDLEKLLSENNIKIP